MAHRPKIDNSVTGVRSNQNLSCNWTGSADFGRLIPFHWEELLPTDKVITCKPRIEMQMLSFAAPTFGKIDLYVHYFLVPIRQLWKDFYSVWSQTGVNKNKQFPWFSPKGLCEVYNNSVSDEQKRAYFKHWTSLGLNPFFALPTNLVTDPHTPISWFPFAAYNKIWWDFYRDPEVLRDESESMYLYTGDISGSEPSSNFGYNYMVPHVRSIKNNWIADLFASPGFSPDGDATLIPQTFPLNSELPYENALGEETFVNGETITLERTDDYDQITYPHKTSSQQLRLMEALTRLSERLSLSGKREIEALFARYGVKPKWSEMNLCRYLGGSKSTVAVADITSSSDTANSEYGSPLGAKGGAGYCALDDLNIEVSVDEPSILMGILSVMPHIHFVQGLSKKWQRRDLVDMFQSTLQYVGQVAVAKREVAMKYRENQSYYDTQDAQTFAFSDPYYEYKMGLDILAGDFMTYHGVNLPTDPRAKKDIMFMQSMEQYIDFPFNRTFNLDNLLIDGDQFNKIFNYLGGSVFEDVDDHFHLCIDKEVLINRPMEGFAIPTLETTQDPHKKTTQLSEDKIL